MAVHARLRHGLGLLQFLAVADYLGRQLAGRDSRGIYAA